MFDPKYSNRMESPFQKHRKGRSKEHFSPKIAGQAEGPARQALRMLAVIDDASRGWPELAKINPELAAQFRQETKDIADAPRRAQANRSLMDMRLD